ncbi:MAG: OmpA family protein [Bacteroidales bacterium]|nr:OmpA family protein [Bacteroidales bacterium]
MTALRRAILVLLLVAPWVAGAQIVVVEEPSEPAAMAEEVAPAVPEVDYKAQFATLSQGYRKNPYDVAVLVGLSDFYADTLNPACDLPLAMEYISHAEQLYVAMANANNSYKEMKRLLKKQISLRTIRDRKQAVIELAHMVVAADVQLDESEIARYAETFKGDATIGKAVRMQRVDGAFLDAKRIGTIDAYYEFEQNYWGTAEADSAEAFIAGMASSLFDHVESEADADAVAQRYAKSESVQRQAQRHKSRLAYATARMKHTVEGYKAFLSAHPSSDEYLQALDEMESLRKVEFDALKTAQDYITFIEQNSDDELAERAMARLCRIIKKEQNVEAAKAYLAKFPLDQNYNDIFRLYYDWHAAEGNLQPIQSFANTYKQYPFRTALQSDLAEAASIDSFNLMRPFVESRRAEYVSFIRHHTGKRIAFVALQRMLQPLRASRDWKGASDRMGSVLLSFEDVSDVEFQQLRAMLTTPSAVVATPLYSANHDLMHPVMHPDGQRLFYTLRTAGRLRIQMVQRGQKPGSWSKAVDIEFANAVDENLTLFNFFDNGRQMLLGSDGDIWIARYDDENNQWRIVEIPPYPVNTDYTETDAYMLPDGTGMLLASDRPGGFNLQTSGANFHGDTALATDIYFIPRTLKGWGTPINLGANINSTYCERTPVLSKNQRTLYFITDGRTGLGYGDIMMATRTNVDDWTQWGTPVNMGREANSCFSEASITFSPAEDYLVMSSNQRGRYEAFQVECSHNRSNTTRTVAVDASRFGNALTQISMADVALQAMTREESYPDASRPITLHLYSGKRYIVYGRAYGFYIVPRIIDNQTPETISLRGYTMSQILALKQPLPLATVVFEKETVQPKGISMVELDNLASFLADNARLRAEIVVACQEGKSKKESFDLSLERAQTLRRYISSYGIDISRIDVSGMGNVANDFPERASGTEVWVRFYE